MTGGLTLRPATKAPVLRLAIVSSVTASATPLLQAGTLLMVVLVGQIVALRHLPAENIPGVLRGRVALSTRLRPWLLVVALAMAATGLGLQFA
jgi:hypothetical protein